MTFFQHDQNGKQRQHRRVFQEPVASDLEDALDEQAVMDDGMMYAYEDDDQDDVDEDDMTDEERALARRDRWQVLAGVGDFLAVIVGTAVILTLIALLVSLINWVHADITQSFTLWQTKL